MLLARSVRLRVLVASKYPYMTLHIIFHYKIAYTRPLAVIGVSFSGLSHFFFSVPLTWTFFDTFKESLLYLLFVQCVFFFHTFTLIMINIVTKGIISSFMFDWHIRNAQTRLYHQPDKTCRYITLIIHTPVFNKLFIYRDI